MAMNDTGKRILLLLLILGLACPLTGCRTRTRGTDAAGGDSPGEGRPREALQGSLPEETAADETPGDGADGRTRENPEASRREYDENAPAEIAAGTDRLLHAEGEGEGAPLPGGEEPVSRLNSRAEETAVQTVASENAEQMGVAEDAGEADSALTYYTVLLQDRTGSMFECQRAHVYWETAEDHVTIHRSSPEHGWILGAGAYDVSARLLPENLRVDDGWVVRKNPGVIVKIVDSAVLGRGTASDGAARAVYRSLLAREGWSAIDAVRNGRVLLLSRELLEAPFLQTAAMLLIARCANPELMADVDPDEAIAMLTEEATGMLPAGLYYYPGSGQ